MLLDLRSLQESTGTVYAYTASGGIIFAGHAAESNTNAYAASGGIVFGGTATDKAIFAYAASGGIIFGGHATEKAVFTYAATGGIVFSGHATEKAVFAYAATSGIVFSGTATVTFVPAATTNTYHYTGAGGLVFSGQAIASGPTGAIDHSGDWWAKRRHAHVSAHGIHVRRQNGQLRGAAAASARASSARVSVRAGIATAAAQSQTHTRSTIRNPRHGNVVVVAQAHVPTTGAETRRSKNTAPHVSAHAMSQSHGSLRHSAVGQVAISIGPDLVAEEFEEIMFLLEVA